MNKINLKTYIAASIILVGAVTILSCTDNDKSNDEKRLLDKIKERDSVSYKLIELLIPISSGTNEYKTYIKFFKEENSNFVNMKQRLSYEIEKDSLYNFEEKKIIKKLINDFTDTTGFDFERLGLDYRNFFNNEGKKTTQTYTLNFSNIVFNDSMNLACTFLGEYYSDERPGSKRGGYDELVIFKKENDSWLFKLRKTLTAY